MNEQVLADRQKRLLAEVKCLVEERAAGEGRIDQQQAALDAEILRDYEQRREALVAEFQTVVNRLRGEYQKRREEVIFAYESNSYAVVQDSEHFEGHAAAEHGRALERVKRVWQVARRTALDQFAEFKDRPRKERERLQRRGDGLRRGIDQTRQQAARLLRRRRCEMPDDLPPATEAGVPDAWEQAQVCLAAAQHRLDEMHRQPAARFLEDGWPFLIFLFTALVLAVPAVWWQGWLIGTGAATVVAASVALLVRRQIRPRARRQTLALLPEFLQNLADAEGAIAIALRRADQEAARQQEELIERRERAVSEAHARWSCARSELTEQHQQRVQQAAEHFKVRRKELKERFQQDLQAVDQQYPPQIRQREERFGAESQALIDQKQQRLAASHEAAAREWQQLQQRWSSGMDAVGAEIDAMNEFCRQHFPAWDAVDWSRWEPGEEDLPVLRFGSMQFALDMLPDGLPQNELLQRPQTQFELPAALSYPACPSLLYLAEGAGREAAIASLQNVMLRLLTSLPPGKVRFTIIDPTGLGQNFSAFMHLADFDERLVASRIWTEVAHINRRLADLTEHMENVIQKYLRNEFESIQEYNRRAGEVAEPFQVLVIANFPANFNEESARRLVSIVSSGARCGVYTLISVDRRLKLPQNFDLADLQRGAAVLQWDESSGSCRWKDEQLGQLPLRLDAPPPGDRFTDIVRAVGERSKDAGRVEVPFAAIVPPADQWWSKDSRTEIEVPLGRAGATNLQHLRLGRGTSQHVLIAGKTGSGKSTLLHTLITSLAIHYSPDEVQFYLIDFKKGVEFKAYAAFALPHARVIAIESEREFGMSVLERLDVELKQRGDLFRHHGVQDLRAYRDARPDSRLARLMLIIDEFQEFFVKDDRISQEAALLLDRLVRQGRAFGIHVLLGSQTLAGAYSLARSTLGQMAVRVALQCSETDAHLILSDDNTAARLLSRPGEAIYNDANGLFEGNHPFQVVWLPDYEREHYLERLSELADRRGSDLPPPIVFEGNVAADPAKNEALRAALEEPGRHAMAPRAWLGEAVAIKDPAAAVFPRQSGSNLLIVGQNESAALGVLANCAISLAADLLGAAFAPGADAFATEGEPLLDDPVPSGASGAEWMILDGLSGESPLAGFWQRLARQLSMPVQVAGPGDASRLVGQLARELQRRQVDDRDAAPPVFLLIHHLSRFRELRKSDDYSFSFEPDAENRPEKELGLILREGPRFGIHTLLWCDTYANLNRWLDRQAINDLAWRVLFQMSATDSANLMDSAEAGRIGVHRAILHNEERGESEKFRPYALPSADWLAWIRSRVGRIANPSITQANINHNSSVSNRATIT